MFVRFVQSLSGQRLFILLLCVIFGPLSYTAQAKVASLQTALEAEVPEILIDSNGTLHELYFSTSHPQFLELIEQSLIDLAQTHMGKSLLQYVLGCDASTIRQHFGISSQVANQLAAECFRNSLTQTNTSPYVLESLNTKPETKISVIPGTSKRQYVLVVSKDSEWNIDSWTDPFSNKTVFVVEKDQAGRANSKTFFYQMMAHEIAIYFDTKAWVGSADWNDIPTYKNSLADISLNKSKVALALNNPLISQILRSLRAFRVEKIFIQQLVDLGRLPIDALDYYRNPNQNDAAEKNGVEQDCTAGCIFKFLESYSPLLLPQSLPLLAFSPQYRSQKVLEVAGNRGSRSVDSRKVIRVLEQNPATYLRDIFKDDPFFNMMNPTLAPGQQDVFKETNEVFRIDLLPEDLRTIKGLLNTSFILDEDFLQFLASPQLGGKNVRLSGGPRPRIRGGKEIWHIFGPEGYIFGPGGYLFEFF